MHDLPPTRLLRRSPISAAPLSAARTPLRILIADDHEVARNGFRLMIEHIPGWTVCGEAATGRQAVELAETVAPDVVVLDMAMPELNGLEAARQIKRRLPETEMLLFTGIRSEALVKSAFEAGARSFLSKTDTGHFIAALEALGNHKTYFTPDVAEILFQRLTAGVHKKNEESAARLTEREREIVQLLVEGHSNKAIASKLGISAKTVEGHRAAIMRKLKLKVFSDLVRWAIRNDFIEA